MRRVTGDAVAEPPVEVTHALAGGGYGEVVAESVRVAVVEVDVATLTARDAAAAEPAGVAGFLVALSRAAAGAVTVNYATGGGGDSATESVDYVSVAGTLSFAAGSTAARTIEVTVLDDALDEPDEQFSLTLSGASVPLAGGGATLVLTGAIEDDEAPPRLSITDGSLSEGDGIMLFPVSLDAASGQAVTVQFATADATATAGADYTGVTGTLTVDTGDTARTIAVQVLDDEAVEETETFVVALSRAEHATVTGGSATGTIVDNDVAVLGLASLQVSGGGTMYPAFDAETHHYAVGCTAGAKLQVSAVAADASQSVTLLRADADNAATAAGSIAAQVQVNDDRDDHDIAVQVTGTDESVTYVVHCLPPEFPDIAVVTRQEDVSDVLLFLVTTYRDEHGDKVRYEMIVDNNGVPRFHRRNPKGWDFRPVRPAGLYRGSEVRYQNGRALYSAEFRLIAEVAPWDGADANNHDFLVAQDGRFIGLYRYELRRDLSEFTDTNGTPYGDNELVVDGHIRGFERGNSVQYWKFSWLAWNARATMKIADCRLGSGERKTLAHINSIQLVDGDIVASIRNCSQVVRIDRGGGTGAVEWKLGGTDPGEASDAEYLEIVDDPAGEFCGQHTATLTGRGTVLLFDNGSPCIGPRKDEAKFTRAVEYDISSGTQAVFVQEYRPPADQGHSNSMGSVYELDNGHWLISWGVRKDVEAELAKRVAVSVVDPGAGRVLLELHISKRGNVLHSYRANWAPESNTAIPLRLP